jgi:hypothetical protein
MSWKGREKSEKQRKAAATKSQLEDSFSIGTIEQNRKTRY